MDAKQSNKHSSAICNGNSEGNILHVKVEVEFSWKTSKIFICSQNKVYNHYYCRYISSWTSFLLDYLLGYFKSRLSAVRVHLAEAKVNIWTSFFIFFTLYRVLKIESPFVYGVCICSLFPVGNLNLNLKMNLGSLIVYFKYKCSLLVVGAHLKKGNFCFDELNNRRNSNINNMADRARAHGHLELCMGSWYRSTKDVDRVLIMD